MEGGSVTSMDTQLYIGRYEPRPESIIRVTNKQWVKPYGGLWTSTYIDNSSGWVDWCLNEQLDWVENRRWFLLVPDPNARIFVVNDIDDMDILFERYQDRLDYPSMSSINFEAMSEDYDAMTVTEDGQWKTRMTFPKNLYGWDCESTCWFRWAFASVEEIEMAL